MSMGLWIPGRIYESALIPLAESLLARGSDNDIRVADNISKPVVQKRGRGYRCHVTVECGDDCRMMAEALKHADIRLAWKVLDAGDVMDENDGVYA